MAWSVPKKRCSVQVCWRQNACRDTSDSARSLGWDGSLGESSWVNPAIRKKTHATHHKKVTSLQLSTAQRSIIHRLIAVEQVSGWKGRKTRWPRRGVRSIPFWCQNLKCIGGPHGPVIIWGMAHGPLDFSRLLLLVSQHHEEAVFGLSPPR